MKTQHVEEVPLRSDRMAGVVVLYNDTTRMVRGRPGDLLAERGVITCAQNVADVLRRAGYRAVLLPLTTGVEEALIPYPSIDWVIFNLAEGLDGRLFEEARIAWALEAMGYRFTGTRGDALVRSTHKQQAKSLLSAGGVPTPPWWLFRHPDEVDAVADAGFPFPLIVKPVAEDASLGIDGEAVVQSLPALRDRVAYVVDHYRQAALAEAFVVGREFNVSLWGSRPDVLPLAEVDFSAFERAYECIVSYAAKWESGSFEYCHTPILCPAPVERSLASRIKSTAQRAWKIMGCRGYARVDMRVSEQGVPYVLEVNCNPDISPDAGFSRAAMEAGYPYEKMVVRILQSARREVYVHDRTGVGDRRAVHSEAGHSGQFVYAHGV
jgi:D-alanine-D-alanine ligase